VLHRDDNKDNNAIGNLYWGTPKQNCDDRARNGHQINLRGEDCPYARLTEDQVREIMASPESYSVIESRFGVSNSMVSFIKSGKRWAHVQGEKLRRKQGPPVGTPSVRRSLTDAQAADVRRRALAGESQRSLATEFGIPQQCVSKIKCGLIYSNA
jgi:hypothetical protein